MAEDRGLSQDSQDPRILREQYRTQTAPVCELEGFPAGNGHNERVWVLQPGVARLSEGNPISYWIWR